VDGYECKDYPEDGMESNENQSDEDSDVEPSDDAPWWDDMTRWEAWEYEWTVIHFSDPLGRIYEEWWHEEGKLFEFSEDLPPEYFVFMMKQDIYAVNADTVSGILTFNLSRPGYRLMTIHAEQLFIVNQIGNEWYQVRTWHYFNMVPDLFFMNPISEDSALVLNFDTFRLHGHFEPGSYRLVAPARLHWVEDIDAEQWHYDWYWQGMIWAEFTVE